MSGMLKKPLGAEESEKDISNIIADLADVKLNKGENSSSKVSENEDKEKKSEEQKDYIKRSIICCKQAMFYRPVKTDHEDLFDSFLEFDKADKPAEPTKDDQRGLQVIRQKNFGPIEEKRYFSLPGFKELSEKKFHEEGYKRLNSFKNVKCNNHNLFFEINAYRKQSAISRHHKSSVNGSSYERDSSQIDLASGVDKGLRK